MVNLIYIFWMYVIVFAFIGAMRGWAKGLLVSFSMIFALTLNFLLRTYAPIIKDLPLTDPSLFWIRFWTTIPLVYFGYQIVASVERFRGKARKEKLQDALFGGVMGAFNGYLIVGTVWAYLHEALYPFPHIFSPATADIAIEIERMMSWMPPYLFGVPGIYFAVVLASVFLIVVYL